MKFICASRPRRRNVTTHVDTPDTQTIGPEEFAAVAMSFPQHSPKWMSRMSEHIDFSDVESYRREITVHVDLDRFRDTIFAQDEHAQITGTRIIVPIGRVRRSLHLGIEVTDGGGNEVPRLS